MGKNRKYTSNDVLWGDIPKLLLTFGVVVMGWIIFRAETIGQAWEILKGIFNASLFTIPYLQNRYFYIPMMSWILILITMEWIYRNKDFAFQNIQNVKLFHHVVVRICLYAAAFLVILSQRGGVIEFIYFQF